MSLARPRRAAVCVLVRGLALLVALAGCSGEDAPEPCPRGPFVGGVGVTLGPGAERPITAGEVQIRQTTGRASYAPGDGAERAIYTLDGDPTLTITAPPPVRGQSSGQAFVILWRTHHPFVHATKLTVLDPEGARPLLYAWTGSYGTLDDAPLRLALEPDACVIAPPSDCFDAATQTILAGDAQVRVPSGERAEVEGYEIVHGGSFVKVGEIRCTDVAGWGTSGFLRRL